MNIMTDRTLQYTYDSNEEGAEDFQQRRGTAGNTYFLQAWEKEKNLGNSGMKVNIKGKYPSRFPTGKDVKSSMRLHRQKRPTMGLTDARASASSLINVIDTYDRLGDAYTEDTYAQSGTYAIGSNGRPMERIPKAGAFAEAGVGRAKAEYSIFDAEAKGPNARAAAEASALGVGAMARAEIGSVAASAGPLTAKLGLGVDTGVSAGVDGLEFKVLGTGIRLGPKPAISFLGSELSCVIQ